MTRLNILAWLTEGKYGKKKSDVKKAVALKYDPKTHGAQKFLQRAQGARKRIIETAIENGVPVKEDPDLVEVLAGLDLEAEVPPEVLWLSRNFGLCIFDE